MSTVRTVLVSATVLVLALALAGCQGQQDAEPAVAEQPIFGDGSPDNSRVVASVNGYDITETMVDLRLEELDRAEQARFQGPDGRRLLVRRMVDEALRVQEARARELPRDPGVRRVLIAREREALDLALQRRLFADREPTIDEVRAYFSQHREDYKRLGTMSALHVQVSDRDVAQEVYQQASAEEVPFAHLVAEYSENDQTRANDGDLGWFNRAGFIPGIRDSKGFTEAIWELDMGVNPPLEYRGHWHVVKVADRKYERLQTLEEAYDRVVRDMLPEYRRTLLEQWLRTAREEADLEYFGEFRPGEGKTAEELFERAFHAKDTQNKLDLLGLLITDYPRSEYADDALFMAGNLVLDSWGDRAQASRFLGRLLEDHPESDYAEDARYILENLHRPGFVNPTSIEDLRRSGE
jgi:hypothetical protein